MDSSHDQSKTTFRKRKYEMKPNLKHGRTGSEIGPYLKTTIDPNQTFGGKNTMGMRSERAHVPAARKNRFYNTIEGNEQYGSIREIVEKYADPVRREEEEEEIENMQSSLLDTQTASPTRIKANSTSKAHRPRRSNYEKSLQKIQNCFLKKVDNYFDQIDSVDIPSSKIELYTAAIHQPSMGVRAPEYKSTAINQEDYDFLFEEQKKKRPKTPYKRNKMYEKA